MHPKSQSKPWKRIPESGMNPLQNDLDKRIDRFVQLKFAIAIFNAWQLAVLLHEENGAWEIPSHFFWADGVKLFLHWLCFYWDYERYSVFGIGTSPMKRMIAWVKRLKESFIMQYLAPRTTEVRLEAAKRNFPEAFNGITLILDGRHSLIKLNNNTARLLYKDRPNGGELTRRDYYSFKLGKSCLNTQVCVAPDDYIEWVSNSPLLPLARYFSVEGSTKSRILQENFWTLGYLLL
jgi:hypothetical protein